MSQDNSTPSSKDFQSFQIYTLLQFCDSRDFDVGQIREISHYKENKQPGKTEVEHLPPSIVI